MQTKLVTDKLVDDLIGVFAAWFEANISQILSFVIFATPCY
jgi:hypothetical protein